MVFLTRAFSPPLGEPPARWPACWQQAPNMCAFSTRTHRVRKASPRRSIAEPFIYGSRTKRSCSCPYMQGPREYSHDHPAVNMC